MCCVDPECGKQDINCKVLVLANDDSSAELDA